MVKRKLYFLLLCLLFGFPLLKAQEYPGTDWNYDRHPEQSGWDTAGLERLKEFIRDSTSITGFMIIYEGRMVFTYGNLKEESYVASCRKSILSMLYGEHVESGEIDLSKSLKDLGLDDVGGLLPIEKEATIKDIISARSGVFHQPGNPGDYYAEAPERGSVKPGEYWLYSNWDFNIAGYIFEKLTGRNIYDEVERILAKPLQMQDWNRRLQHKDGDTTKSRYQAYPMWFTTRDMARIGLLMLYNGKWERKQIISESWIKEMLTPRTNYAEVNRHISEFRKSNLQFGYGYMWWLWQDPFDERFTGAYSAFGAYGQSISVFPAINTVVVFKTSYGSTSNKNRYRVAELAAKCKKMQSGK